MIILPLSTLKDSKKLSDLLIPNGIEVDVPYEMSDGIGMTLKKGKQQLHGKELLDYVRFRQDRLSDFGRVQRQQEVISKLMEGVISINNIYFLYLKKNHHLVALLQALFLRQSLHNHMMKCCKNYSSVFFKFFITI